MTNNKARILIVDDERVICDGLGDALSEQGYRCAMAFDGKEALSKLGGQDFAVVLLDIRLPGMSGMEVLREIWLNHINTAVIMLTAVNDVATAVEAMKLGALDYIVKPFDLDRVATSITTALETERASAKSSTRMDAIAIGVEANLDPLSTYSNLVTERTVDIARQLGIAEKEIQRWAAEKRALDSKREKIIKS